MRNRRLGEEIVLLEQRNMSPRSYWLTKKHARPQIYGRWDALFTKWLLESLPSTQGKPRLIDYYGISQLNLS